MDALCDMVWAADDPDVVEDVVEGNIRVGHVRVVLEEAELLAIGQEFQEVALEITREGAVHGLSPGLLGGLCDIDFSGDAPGGAVGGESGLGGAALDGAPMAWQGRGGNEVDAHGDVAALSGKHKGF